MRETGWYKVKIYTKWMCAYFDGFCFVIFTEDLTNVVYFHLKEIDQIGDKIEFSE